MNINKYITKLLREGLKVEHKDWYHGTPDVRYLEKEGGFTEQIGQVEYVKDPDKFDELQQKMVQARENGDDEQYHKYLNMVPNLKGYYKMRKPVFLTNNFGVAKSYADPWRSVDYKNAVEKVLKVEVNPGKVVTINAPGDRFRFISINKVRRAFISAGTSEEDIDKAIRMFNYYVQDKQSIKTDIVAVIGQWLGYDTIDVVGVLDSYNGGSVKSTVRMVFDPSNIKIIE
jgi:hypothetical protein